jgi:hypothetical protein
VHLTLTRIIHANGAVIGELEGLSVPLYTLELEWKNNNPKVSCIPPGTYRVVPHGWEKDSPVKYPRTWRLLDVPNRSDILLHIGNYVRNTLGCILPGMGMQITQKFSMVSDSGTAIEIMRREIGNQEFVLTVK